MAIRKFGTGQVTGTDSSDLSKTAVRDSDFDENDRMDLARENQDETDKDEK